MSFQKRKSISKIILGVLLLLLLQIYSFSWWCANESDIGFIDNPTIKNCIVNGAGFFLDSYANTLLFMKKTEYSVYQDMNYDELGKIVDNALEYMNHAIENYENLKQAADNTSYNPSVIGDLKNYNYDYLRETSGLNDAVFTGVKMYLVNGDIRGIYGEMLSNTKEIRDLLLKVKASIDDGKFPALTDVWNLNQAFSGTLLFGQYVSHVFHDTVNK